MVTLMSKSLQRFQKNVTQLDLISKTEQKTIFSPTFMRRARYLLIMLLSDRMWGKSNIFFRIYGDKILAKNAAVQITSVDD